MFTQIESAFTALLSICSLRALMFCTLVHVWKRTYSKLDSRWFQLTPEKKLERFKLYRVGRKAGSR